MKYLITIALLFCYSNLSAQVIATQLDKNNIVYVGMDNPLTIAVEGYPCKSLLLKTDNGTISGENGHYMLKPSHYSTKMEVHVKAKTANGTKELGVHYFRAVCLAAPVINILGKESGGKLSAQKAHSAIAPLAIYENGGFMCGNGIIDSATIIVIRNKTEILNKRINGPNGIQFIRDNDVQTVIDKLQPYDKLKLIDITYKGPSTLCGNNHLPDYELNIVP